MAFKSIVWNLFCKTGSVDMYLLYNCLTGREEEGDKQNATGKDQRAGFKTN